MDFHSLVSHLVAVIQPLVLNVTITEDVQPFQLVATYPEVIIVALPSQGKLHQYNATLSKKRAEPGNVLSIGDSVTDSSDHLYYQVPSISPLPSLETFGYFSQSNDSRVSGVTVGKHSRVLSKLIQMSVILDLIPLIPAPEHSPSSSKSASSVGTPWWVWFIIVLVVLLLVAVAGLAFFFIRRRKALGTDLSQQIPFLELTSPTKRSPV